jgi:ElaB/YqjD/DUF883 family membrane-anchored ribosome-binding protein
MAQELVTQAKEKADEATSNAAQRARAQLDSGSTKLGEQVSAFGAALRRAAEQLEDEGGTGPARAAHQAANQVDRIAIYLKNVDSDRFLGDVERFARQRPWAAGGVGAVSGFVAARFMKASSDDRYTRSQRFSADADLPLPLRAESRTTSESR